MNWKIILGILLIYGGLKEFFAEAEDYRNGTTGNPILAQALCSAIALLGGYLLVKGIFRKKKS